VTADCIKLTSYFGERHRTGGTLTADALLGLYGRHEIAASILLRGTGGFGLKHRLRTDRSLSLSEDLPLIAVAVDTRSRIEAVLPQVLTLNRTGLVTMERARLLTDLSSAGWSPASLPEATKLTIYLGRRERVGRVPAFIAVCDLLHRRGLDGATALLGVDGTAHGRRERAAFFSRNAEVPMMVIAVGSGSQIGAVLPELGPLLRHPLVTAERVRVCKRDGRLLAPPPALSGADDGMALWHKLMVYTSEALLHHGEPVHRAVVRRLRSAGLSGATTQRGVWGFHGDQAPHGDRLLQLGRHVPAVTIVIDTPDRIGAAFSVIDELTSEGGLVTSEIVPAIRPGAGP
jgi:PII-like signaling protein